jgi:hypothetical protein
MNKKSLILVETLVVHTVFDRSKTHAVALRFKNVAVLQFQEMV